MLFLAIFTLLTNATISSARPTPGGANWLSTTQNGQTAKELIAPRVIKNSRLTISGSISEKISGISTTDGEAAYMEITDAAKRFKRYTEKGKAAADDHFKDSSYTFSWNNQKTNGSQSRKLTGIHIVEPTATYSTQGQSGGHNVNSKEAAVRGELQGTDPAKIGERLSSKDITSILANHRSKGPRSGQKESPPQITNVRVLEETAECSICQTGYRGPRVKRPGEVEWNLVYNCPNCLAHYHFGCLKTGSSDHKKFCPNCDERPRSRFANLRSTLKNYSKLVSTTGEVLFTSSTKPSAKLLTPLISQIRDPSSSKVTIRSGTSSPATDPLTPLISQTLDPSSSKGPVHTGTLSPAVDPLTPPIPQIGDPSSSKVPIRSDTVTPTIDPLEKPGPSSV
ncbi:hypothetical protein PSTT_09867 [Puccinia striiformis]|uniref:Zinc finger PHD-type domain-containing protein n=1 Tax=Puccinia striiformis TaxID=27350 RepID=A0A2S4V6X6_9BASI|nr:hypothetical protein PSTT_09867 [Puccinia striiformis]